METVTRSELRRFRNFMKRHQLTGVMLGQKLGVSRARISQILCADAPAPQAIEQLRAAAMEILRERAVDPSRWQDPRLVRGPRGPRGPGSSL